MGLFFLQAFGEKDQVLIEEIAKSHGWDTKVVAELYKELLEKAGKENAKVSVQVED